MKKWRFMLAYSSETKIYSNFHNEIFVPSTCCNICDIAFLRCPFQRMRFIPKNQSNHAKTFFSSVQLFGFFNGFAHGFQLAAVDLWQFPEGSLSCRI